MKALKYIKPFDYEAYTRRAIAKDAHKQLNQAVRTGLIAKPDICEVCDESLKLQAHHPDYNYPLDVIWVCHRCHRQIHKYCEVVYIV